MKKIHLKKNKDHRLLSGHLWVFAGEIESQDKGIVSGDEVDVFSSRGHFLARGIYNQTSQIRVRVLTRDVHQEINSTFIHERILQAWLFRQKIGYGENCRVVFGESDFLPGLIVDKFGDVLSVQIFSLALEKFKDDVFKSLQEIFSPRAIFERSDIAVRKLEGLEERKVLVCGQLSDVTVIDERGVKFFVDIENGQKTGFFLDQKENRLALKTFVKDAEVLDCFTYTGSFALFAAHFGAKKVTALDISGAAVAAARRNAELNGLASVCEFIEANAFDLLKEWSVAGRQFDVIILDPPAFTKTRTQINSAVRGYKEINLRALKMIKPGGFLITCSCSHFMHPGLFRDVIQSAAIDASRTVREIVYQTQAKDHPYLWAMPETLYLKFYVLQVM